MYILSNLNVIKKNFEKFSDFDIFKGKKSIFCLKKCLDRDNNGIS